MEEDIKILEEFIDGFRAMSNNGELVGGFCDGSTYIRKNTFQAIENLLSRLKTAERMNDVLAEHISERCHYIDDYSNSCDVIEDSCYENKDCKECIKEWARKKVEENV